MLLADRCPCCGRVGPSPCRGCASQLALAPPLEAPPPLDSLAALLVYTGPARPLVAGLKRRHARSALAWLADGMAPLAPAGVTVVAHAPTSARRAAGRGVDHAGLLASAVARRSALPAAPLLRRQAGPPQTGRDRRQRLLDPPRFSARQPLAGHRVLLVDDVVTTGATLAAAARAILQAGAAAVHGLVAAATPAPAAGGPIGRPPSDLRTCSSRPMRVPMQRS